MVMLSQNLSPWVFLSPDSKALSVLFRGGALEMTEMVVSLLPRCDWCRLPPLARHIRVLRVRCVWLLSARVTLALKVPFYLRGWWRYSDSRGQCWGTSPFVLMWPWEVFFLIYTNLHFCFKSACPNRSSISPLAINTNSGCLNQTSWSSLEAASFSGIGQTPSCFHVQSGHVPQVECLCRSSHPGDAHILQILSVQLLHISIHLFSLL